MVAPFARPAQRDENQTRMSMRDIPADEARIS
jgi:hypothetical protein